MALTSYLGTQDSRFSNIIFGQWQARVVPGRIGTIVVLAGQYRPKLPRRRP